MPSDLERYPAAEVMEVVRWIAWRDEEAKEKAARASLDGIARDPHEDTPKGPKVIGRKA